MSLYGTGVTSVTAWPPVSQVSLSLHGPWSVARCHRHCVVPGVWHSVAVTACPHAGVTDVTIPAWSLECGAASLSPHSRRGVTQCHRGCTVPLVSHSAAAQPCSIAQRHCCSLGCHMVSLSPRSAQGVTVTAGPPGATQCDCSSRGLSHRVTVNAWCMGCHIVLCHCMAHGVSPSVTVTAVPQCITQCRCHCMAHGVSPSVTVTAWPGVSRTITAQDAPRCHPLHVPWAVTQCCRAPPQLHHAPSPPAVRHPGDSTAGPSSPSPRYSLPHVPLGGHVPEPVPSAHLAPRPDLAARRAAISHHSPAGPISRPLIK